MLAYEPRATPDAHGEHKCVPLSAFGLPRSVCVRYESAKVVQLFPWQRDCLLMDDGQVLHGKRNLVYSAPTSGGKTLVAEILMLRRLASLQGNLLRDRSAACRVGVAGEGAAPMRGLGTILFVVPFVALAEEKADYFRSMWQDMHIGVQSYHGDDEGP